MAGHESKDAKNAKAAKTTDSKDGAPPAPFLARPPADANIPAVPRAFQKVKGGMGRGKKPKNLEKNALPGALTELASFHDYGEVLGRAGPPLEELREVLETANAWTLMRKRALEWAEYAAHEEGTAWVSVRTLMKRLKPAFELATAMDAELRNKYLKLSSLLDAKKMIARKGAATRAAKKEEGEE